MADKNNSGQFGNRSDTKEMGKGGHASDGQNLNNVDRSAAGKKGAAAQPTEAKRLGGESSHRNR